MATTIHLETVNVERVSVETVLEQIRQLPHPDQIKVKQALAQNDQRQFAPVNLPSRLISTGNEFIDRTAEYNWLNQHEQDYIGQWVALSGAALIAHGLQAKAVYEQAHAAGAPDALVLFIENPNEPYMGW